ncbi:MAG: 16S rRNA (guanine(966)-N(2))-methyltransferase RsmD [Spirochaetota bacterium]
MRITGGNLRSRKVEVPTGRLEIRPAMDMMRESIFSILGDLSGLSFLDLFSGSGILGLEASSRGADPVACVEKDREKFPLLLKNVGIAERRIECHCMPAERFLLRNRSVFSIVFLDPPFPYAHRRELLQNLAVNTSLAPGGLALIHFPREDKSFGQVQGLTLEDEREYGRSIVRFYRRESSVDKPAPDPIIAAQ